MKILSLLHSCKLLPSFLHGYHDLQLQNLAIFYISHPTIPKFSQPYTWGFFALLIPLKFLFVGEM